MTDKRVTAARNVEAARERQYQTATSEGNDTPTAELCRLLDRCAQAHAIAEGREPISHATTRRLREGMAAEAQKGKQ